MLRVSSTAILAIAHLTRARRATRSAQTRLNQRCPGGSPDRNRRGRSEQALRLTRTGFGTLTLRLGNQLGEVARGHDAEQDVALIDYEQAVEPLLQEQASRLPPCRSRARPKAMRRARARRFSMRHLRATRS